MNTQSLLTIAAIFAALTSGCATTETVRPGVADVVEVKSQDDIVGTAVSAGQFSTLVAAVSAADLVATLKSKGPFTVFAPTDAAFAKLPEGVLDDLLKPENKEKLQAILKHHVVPGRVTAKQVMAMKEAATVHGSTLEIGVASGAVMVAGAKVLKTDIICSNGVIHVIDAVVLPQ